MVKRLLGMLIGIAALGLGTASAGTVALNDWCFNQNGDINASCNFAGPAPVGFDAMLSPAINSLGTATFTLKPAQYIAIYSDYDVNFAIDGSFQDQATAVGALPTGWSYELDDPNTSNIFSDFSANTLTNVNNVSTGAAPPAVCCDVSWALAIGGVSQASTVKFKISTTAPASGFYLQQTNINSGDSIYLSASVTPQGGGGGTVPEPSTLLLVGAGGGLVIWRRRKAILG